MDESSAMKGPSLLDSPLAALEPPASAMPPDIELPPEKLVEHFLNLSLSFVENSLSQSP